MNAKFQEPSTFVLRRATTLAELTSDIRQQHAERHNMVKGRGMLVVTCPKLG